MEGSAQRQTSVVALLSVFGLGIAFVIVGAISVEYGKAIQIENIGNLTFALFLTSCIVQLVIGPLVDRFGYRSCWRSRRRTRRRSSPASCWASARCA